MSTSDKLVTKVQPETRAKITNIVTHPSITEAFSTVNDSRAGVMTSPAPKVKDAEVDVIKTALHNPPQRPDLAATIIGAGGSLSAIVSAIKDLIKGSDTLFNSVLLLIGAILFALQLGAYFFRKREDPWHDLAKRYVDALLEEIAEHRRMAGQTEDGSKQRGQ